MQQQALALDGGTQVPTRAGRVLVEEALVIVIVIVIVIVVIIPTSD